MRLVANRQLTGVYGTVAPHQVFDAPDDVGVELLRDGKARRPDPPAVIETKVFRPPEVGPVIPFRDVSVPDPEQASVVAARDSVLSVPDVPEQGTPDTGRRRKRLRLGPKGKR